jgi:hypothetical protein
MRLDLFHLPCLFLLGTCLINMLLVSHNLTTIIAGLSQQLLKLVSAHVSKQPAAHTHTQHSRTHAYTASTHKHTAHMRTNIHGDAHKHTRRCANIHGDAYKHTRRRTHTHTACEFPYSKENMLQIRRWWCIFLLQNFPMR